MRNGESARVIYDLKCEGWIDRYNTDFHCIPHETWMLTGMAEVLMKEQGLWVLKIQI